MRNMIIYMIICILASVLFCQNAKEPPEEFNRGVEFFQQGKYSEAIEQWRKVIEIDENLAAAWFNMAVAYDITGQDSLAIECYHRAAELRPEDPDPWIYLAQLHRRREEPYLAAHAYKNACQRRNDDPELLNGLAIALDMIGDFAGAIEALNNAIGLDSLYLSAQVNKIIVHNHAAQYDSAIIFGEETVNRFPDEPISWAQLGYAYHKLGQDKIALSAVDSALAIFENLAMAHYYRGLILLSLGNKNEAIEEIEKAIKLHDEYRETAFEDAELKPLMDMPEFQEILR